MKQVKITLESILPNDTEVVFNWRYKRQVKENDFWGWNSGYGRKGMSVADVIRKRCETGFGGKIENYEFDNIRFVTNDQYDAIVRATSGD